MIFFMTVSSSMGLVEKRPDIIERVLKSVLEGIAVFKTDKETTRRIDDSGFIDALYKK